MSIVGTLAVAITIGGNTPTFTPQQICVVNITNHAEKCETTHSITFKLSPGRYQINVDGKKASTSAKFTRIGICFIVAFFTFLEEDRDGG